MTIGGAIGDRGRELRLYSRTLFSMGYRRAATQILCNDEKGARALAVQGIDCRTGAYRTGGAVAEVPDLRGRHARREIRHKHVAVRTTNRKLASEGKLAPAAEAN